MKFKSIFFITYLSVMIVIGLSSNVAFCSDEIDKFKFIDCDSEETIENTRFFFIKSKHGFIYNSRTGSPLQDDVPEEVGMTSRPLPGEEISTSTIVLQEIITKPLKGRTLEGGIPGLYIITIACGIIGVFVAPMFRKNSGFGLIVGLLIGYLGSIAIIDGVFKVTENDICLHIDNALDEDIEFYLDKYEPIKVPSKSQLPIGFEEGRRSIKITSASTNKILESFSLEAYKYRDNLGKALYGYYVYNIGGQNRYKIVKAFYEYKK